MNKETTFSDALEYITELKAKCDFAEKEVERVKADYIPSSDFKNIPLTVAEVAKLKGRCEHTVRSYIDAGMIPLHKDSTDSSFKIDASVALKLDFDRMKHERRYKN